MPELPVPWPWLCQSVIADTGRVYKRADPLGKIFCKIRFSNRKLQDFNADRLVIKGDAGLDGWFMKNGDPR